MSPIERYKKANTEGNLWIYILSIGQGQEVKNEAIPRLIFEKFAFLPSDFLTMRVLFRLRQQGYVSDEKNQGKKAYKTTEKGMEQLGMMKAFCQNLLQQA
jgi:DNA-binding PadR family transcriptional regulator